MNAQTDKPQGRSVRELRRQELRRIIAAEDARRADLMEAWAELTEAEQFALVRYAQDLAGTP
jgi:hypothetical protein